MGSVNCKEYVTNKKDNSSTNETADNGTTGSYHSTCEADMATGGSTETVEICNITELEENEMKTFDLSDSVKLLLIKQNGVVNALGNKCTHYGAPMNTGSLGLGRIRCPWHGACFNIETGDIEDFPGMDSLPCYKVQVTANGKVMVHLKPGDRETNKRVKYMVPRSLSDKRTFVIIGGGPAGATCAETLRQESFPGRIVMICREKHLPYDRVKVTKALNIDIESILYRQQSFYDEHSIETLLDVSATKLDVQNKSIKLSNNETIQFDKVFIATGCRAFKPTSPGSDFQNVVTLRDYADASKVHLSLNIGMNVVCFGGSFIAMESAAYLHQRVKSITVIARAEYPFKHIFGSVIGERILHLFEEKGITMLMKSGIKEIIGNSENKVTELKLLDDTTIPCDLLIMGIGTRYNTEFLEGSGINMNTDGTIEVDKFQRTNFRDIYAGGDIVKAPMYSLGMKKANVQHIQVAQYHGRIAAMNMCGSAKEARTIPFFFTAFFGKGIRFSGQGASDNIHIVGSLEAMKFVAYYLDKENYVVGILSCQRDPIVAQFIELQAQGKRIVLSELQKENPDAWLEKLNVITPCTI